MNKHVCGELFCHLLDSLCKSFLNVIQIYPTVLFEKLNFTLSKGMFTNNNVLKRDDNIVKTVPVHTDL